MFIRNEIGAKDIRPTHRWIEVDLGWLTAISAQLTDEDGTLRLADGRWMPVRLTRNRTLLMERVNVRKDAIPMAARRHRSHDGSRAKAPRHALLQHDSELCEWGLCEKAENDD